MQLLCLQGHACIYSCFAFSGTADRHVLHEGSALWALEGGVHEQGDAVDE
jgi:hypothetical protein